MATGLSLTILFIIYAIYMVYADKVYFLLSGKSYIEKIPNDHSLSTMDNLPMRSVADHPPTNNRFEEGKGFRGQFVGVENKKGKTNVRVFFRSADALYELVANRRLFWEGADKTVVDLYASTAGLEKGIYQMGLFLSDDKGERFAWIYSFFEKANGGPVEYLARPVAPVPAKSSQGLKFDIEDLIRKYKKVVCQGWTVLENAEMNDFNAYLLFKDSAGVSKTFYSPLFARTDLLSKHTDRRAVNCEFRIKVPQDELPPGNYTVAVVLRSRKNGEAIQSAQNKKINLPPTLRGFSARIRRH